MILIRAINGWWTFLFNDTYSRITPSILILTFVSRSKGSIWISLALLLIARSTKLFNRWMIIDVASQHVELEAVAMVDKELAQKNLFLPLSVKNRTMTLVTNDPLNYFALEEVRQQTGFAATALPSFTSLRPDRTYRRPGKSLRSSAPPYCRLLRDYPGFPAVQNVGA